MGVLSRGESLRGGGTKPGRREFEGGGTKPGRREFEGWGY